MLSLIGLIGYSYQQVATSFPEAGLQRTPRLSVLGPEKFRDG